MHQGPHTSITVDAGEDLSSHQYKAISLAGTIAASSALAIGLLQNKPGATGRRASVAWNGHLKAYAGAAINSGSQVQVTTSGWIIASTSAGNTVGVAITGAASGDVFDGIYNFVNGDA